MRSVCIFPQRDIRPFYVNSRQTSHIFIWVRIVIMQAFFRNGNGRKLPEDKNQTVTIRRLKAWKKWLVLFSVKPCFMKHIYSHVLPDKKAEEMGKLAVLFWKGMTIKSETISALLFFWSRILSWVKLGYNWKKKRRCRSTENCLIAAILYKSTVKHPAGELPGVSRGV